MGDVIRLPIPPWACSERPEPIPYDLGPTYADLQLAPNAVVVHVSWGPFGLPGDHVYNDGRWWRVLAHVEMAGAGIHYIVERHMPWWLKAALFTPLALPALFFIARHLLVK